MLFLAFWLFLFLSFSPVFLPFFCVAFRFCVFFFVSAFSMALWCPLPCLCEVVKLSGEHFLLTFCTWRMWRTESKQHRARMSKMDKLKKFKKHKTSTDINRLGSMHLALALTVEGHAWHNLRLEHCLRPGRGRSSRLTKRLCSALQTCKALENRGPQPAPMNYDLLADFVLGLVDGTHKALSRSLFRHWTDWDLFIM